MAEFGQSGKQGIQIALDQAKNTAGNYTIQTVFYDDRNEESNTVNGAKKLILQDKVKIIIGSCSSRCSIPLSEMAEKYKVPMITPTASNPLVTVDGKRKSYVFRGCFTDPYQSKLAATFILETLKLKNVAVMYNIESTYSTDLADELKYSLENNGGSVAAFEGYTWEQEDFASILERIEKQNPEVIYLPDYYDTASLIVKQARERGIKSKIVGCDGWDSEELDYATMEGNYFTNFGSNSDPNSQMQRFVQLYKAKYGSEPDLVAISAYDAALMALNAITRANSADANKLKAALQATKDFPTSTGKITIDPNGNPIKPGVIMEIKDNKPIYNMTLSPMPKMLTSSFLDKPFYQPIKDTIIDKFTLVPYEDPNGEFDILVPKGWTTLGNGSYSGTQVLLTKTASNEDEVYLTVATNNQLYDIFTKNGIDNGAIVLKKIVEDDGNIGVTEVKKVIVSGIPSIRLISTYMEQSKKVKSIEQITIINGKCYIVTFKGEENQCYKYENALMKCLDSIQIYYVEDEDETA